MMGNEPIIHMCTHKYIHTWFMYSIKTKKTAVMDSTANQQLSLGLFNLSRSPSNLLACCALSFFSWIFFSPSFAGIRNGHNGRRRHQLIV